MSDYSAIADIGETLKKLLWENFAGDLTITEIVGSEAQITLLSPDEMDEGSSKISLFLYQITENSHMKNQEMMAVNNGTLQYPPLTVDFLFLVTCHTDDRSTDHLLMGKIMQIFHDQAVLKGSTLKGNLAGSQEEFRLVFYTLPFEETINLWQSFREKSYRLSVCYRVTPVQIDSTRQKEMARVSDIDGTYHPQPLPPED